MTAMKTLAMAVLMMTVSAGLVLAQGQGRTNERLDVCGTIYNECCDEDVEVCVSAKIQYDKDGNATKVSYHGTGTGLSSGAEYVVGTAQSLETHTNANNGNSTFTLSATIKMVSKGNTGCNFQLKVLIHFTTNANGDVTSEVVVEEVRCNGGGNIE